MYQMRHSISEHGRIDLLQIIVTQIEHIQVSETRESVCWKLVNRITPQSQLLQGILETAPIVWGDLWYFVSCTKIEIEIIRVFF